MSAKDFVKKVQELREELTREHQQHIRDIQEAARQDTDVKLTELQARHDHEVRQLQHLHERKLEQALSEQQQELEKQHKTELNNLRLKHQQEIDRLRNEELASLTDSSVTQRLQADVAVTQQMDQHLVGSLRPEGEGQDDVDTAETGSTVSATDDVLPARLQALLNRLRELGEHVLSVSELDFLQRHLTPEREVGADSLRQAWEGEKLGLVKTVHALKELLSQADRVGAGLDEALGDWRSELVHALVEVYKRERLALEAELHTLRLQHANQDNADIIKIFDNRLREQEQLHQSGLDAMLRAERQSLLAELEDVHARLVQQRKEQQEQRTAMTENLAQQEENASNTQWKLQRQIQVLEYKLQQEKVIEDDLKKGLEAERRRVAELSAELSRDKGSLISLQSELQSTQIHLSRTKDALEREQSRFTSVTDALEEEREKNNRLADMLETLRRQHHSLESDLGRTEAMRRERESAESRFIKELQAELASEREQLHKAVKAVEDERREKQRTETELEKEQEQTEILNKEMEKLRRQTKKALDGEATKMQELLKLLKQEQNEISQLQRLLQDKETTIAQDSNRIKDLQAQVQQLQRGHATLEQHLESERRKATNLASIMDSEREKQAALQEQEHNTVRQLRHELTSVKTEASEARRHLELEKSRADGLRLELERAQSELRAIAQHAGATERQLETEHSTTWNKLRLAQRERDELQMKVHELGLELERLQDKLQDLELELDRSRQRELEARHDVERQKLYPTVSPRTAPDAQASASDSQLQKRLSTFCQQLQSVGQRLHTLAQRQRDHNNTITESEDSDADGNRGRSAVEAVISELQVLQKKMASGSTDEVDAVPVVSQEVEDLQKRVNIVIRERDELQRRLTLLENEDNRRTPRSATVTVSTGNRQAALTQYVSDATSDDEFLYERTVWASERLSLQMALDSAEHEIDRLKKELRQFRGRFDSEGFMVETDRDKMQRLYGKYLRAESFRKALVYQKKYLLLLLGGYQDSEQETLAVIATMGGQPSSTYDLALRRRHRRLYTIFRSAARMVIAIFRMKYLVRKWKRAMRVGSPVVSGRVNQQYDN
nr:hypothetical protein BaRGS_025722 [Batillaria attramentaria]